MDQEFKLTMPNRLRRSPKGHYARKSPYTANTDDADITSFGLIAARCVIYQLVYFVRDQRLAFPAAPADRTQETQSVSARKFRRGLPRQERVCGLHARYRDRTVSYPQQDDRPKGQVI